MGHASAPQEREGWQGSAVLGAFYQTDARRIAPLGTVLQRMSQEGPVDLIALYHWHEHVG
jgi:hypothetical protein